MKKQFFNLADINICEFEKICSQIVNIKDYNFCSAIQKKIVIYEGDYLISIINSPESVIPLFIQLALSGDSASILFLFITNSKLSILIVLSKSIESKQI